MGGAEEGEDGAAIRHAQGVGARARGRVVDMMIVITSAHLSIHQTGSLSWQLGPPRKGSAWAKRGEGAARCSRRGLASKQPAAQNSGLGSARRSLRRKTLGRVSGSSLRRPYDPRRSAARRRGAIQPSLRRKRVGLVPTPHAWLPRSASSPH